MKNEFLLFYFILFLIHPCIGQENKEFEKIFDTEKHEGLFKAKVSILGVFHFTNSVTHDYNDTYKVNTLSKKRQEELKILLDKLKTFRPTKILIERDRINQDSLINNQYENYLSGKEKFHDNDEVYQIAFPLAKKLNLSKIYASDATAEWFGVDLDWNNFDDEAYLKSKNQYEKSNRYNYNEVYQIEDSLKSILNLTDYLKLINTPQLQHYNHQIYLTESVLSGAGDNYLGADSVARWYRRNLRIFSNVLDIVDFDKEERLLIIYGASHIWTLKQFFKDSPDFEYIEINNYLND